MKYLNWVLDNGSMRLRWIASESNTVVLTERPLYREIIDLLKQDKIPSVDEHFDWGFSLLLREPWVFEAAKHTTPQKLAWFLNWAVVGGVKEGAQYMWFDHELPTARMNEVPMVWEDDTPTYAVSASKEDWELWLKTQ